MNCKQCGTKLEGPIKFCPQCGAKYRHEEEVHRTVEQYEKGLVGFAYLLFNIIKAPISSVALLPLVVERGKIIIYIAMLIILNVCSLYLIGITILLPFLQYYYDIVSYALGYDDMLYFIEQGQVFIFIVVGIVYSLFIIEMIIGLRVGFRLFLKEKIEYIECMQRMMIPMTLEFFTRVIMVIIGLWSVKGALVTFSMFLMSKSILFVAPFLRQSKGEKDGFYIIIVAYILSYFSCIYLILRLLNYCL